MLLPYLVHHLPLGSTELTPAEVQKILQDRPFQQMLWQVRMLNQSTLDHYKVALRALENQLAQIETELNSGRF
jgi:hypothetical protein